MKTLLTFIMVAFVATVSVSAQDWAKARLEKSPRHGEWVKVKHGDREVNCFITYPEVKEKATAVVVVHEIFGLSDWVRGVTDQLAEAGYIAIAPDLLTGTAGAEGSEGARRVIGNLPADQITADLNAVVDYVAKLPSCNGKVAVSGFCWGGGQVFRFATDNKDIKAVLSFYGAVQTDKTAVTKINCPVYGFYGEKDARITATVADATKAMKDAGKTYEPVVYPGAGHGFMREGETPTSTDANHEANIKARDEAWKRIKELLGKI